MVKSALDLLATNKNYRTGVATGMMLAKTISKSKKMKGGKSFGWKQAIALLMGPFGWTWLAKHANDDQIASLQKRLETYEPLGPEEERLYDKDEDKNDNNYDPAYDPEDFELIDTAMDKMKKNMKK